jgi:murein DD-endopeptidase MepM/ murein hydrolase activator NlpD
VRFGCGALLLCLAGCTTYHPVDWSERAGLGARPPAPVVAAASEGVRHRVSRGDTLSEVAQRYGVTMGDLARVNGIVAPYRLYAGQYLTVPARTGAAEPMPSVAMVVPARRTSVPQVPEAPPAPRTRDIRVASLEPDPPVQLAPPLPRERLEASRGAAGREAPALSGDGFVWPVKGKIASAFGSKPNGTRNDGVNIRAAEGTPVVAAENGIVVFAGDEIPGFGQMLLVSHANGFLTAYAHNRELLVAVGDEVERGQRIASVGSSGNVTSPQLHFEVREGKEPVDPMLVLAPAATQVASVR